MGILPDGSRGRTIATTMFSMKALRRQAFLFGMESIKSGSILCRGISRVMKLDSKLDTEKPKQSLTPIIAFPSPSSIEPPPSIDNTDQNSDQTLDEARSPSPNASMDNHAAVHSSSFSSDQLPAEPLPIDQKYHIEPFLFYIERVRDRLAPLLPPLPPPLSLLELFCKLPAEIQSIIRSYVDAMLDPSVKFYQSMVDRIIVQQEMHRSHGFKDASETKKKLALRIEHRSDPLQPSDFRRANEQVHALGSQIESVYFKWQNSEDTTSLDIQMDRLLAERQLWMDRSFDMFVDMIGARDPAYIGLVSFNKQEADIALEEAIGSIDRHRDAPGVFAFTGCLPLDFSNDDDAARGYSIYLGRKGYSNVDPRQAREETEKFAERVMNPPPPLSPADRTEKNQALCLLRRVCQVLFTPNKPKEFYQTAPNSGKSCLEVPLRKGGKRAAIYLHKNVSGSDHVRADTILSAGKFRTITVSSAYYSKYSWLNGYMFSRLRNCRWMVSGKTVDSWVASIGSIEADWFCSGDGKACTDYFDSDYCDEVLNFFAEVFDLDLEELQSFTTQAVIEVNGRFILQRRGQLMGSDFSFPILCLLSFFAHLIGEDKVKVWLKLNDQDLEYVIREYGNCGVNGDDIVSWGDSRSSSRWLHGFNIIGGVANAAKSPMSREYFTINSQLWRRKGKDLVKIRSVLPAMLLGICGKAHLAPDESWADLLSSPLLSRDALARSQLDLVLLPELPRSLGGLGIDFRRIPHYLLRNRYYWALASRKRNWNALADFSDEHIQIQHGHVQILEDEVPKDRSQHVSGWIRTSEKKKIAMETFGSPKGLRWTDTNGKSASPFYIRQWIYFKSLERADVSWIHDWREREYTGWSFVRSVHPAITDVQSPGPVIPKFHMLEPRSVQEEISSMVKRKAMKAHVEEKNRKRRSNFCGKLTTTAI
uniref:Replicase n=1 Tax=Agaricus bisporus virus 15 TaxID=1945745 RepID=A0A1Q1N6J6_9VIRU|nr:replicase [Agaricus bisporus virus 15]